MSGASLLQVWEGRPPHAWRTAWGLPALEIRASIGSTNDRAGELAAAGVPAFSVVIAEEQTAGRGRSGRRWASPPGMGLWMSIVLRPEAVTPRPLLSVALGAVVASALETLVTPAVPGLKWPNDVEIAGRKVGGILCETGGAAGTGAVIAGIGINVRQRADDFDPELRENATSVLLATGLYVDRAELAGRILHLVHEWLVPAPRKLEGELARHVARFDLLRGRQVVTSDGASGLAAGIAPDGALLIADERGARRRVLAGSVTLTRDPRRRERVP
ncbi:MAG: biotin--[acetyl-CoA-carboxylase] ligase [Gemmatimonadetes bacterium]|nr:biotin--[acetyl-CoA-carboxylase] ligase [Gemmatimonadota bacterium]